MVVLDRAGLATPLFEMIDVGEQVPGDGLVGVGLMESTSATSWASALLASRLPPRNVQLTYRGRAVIGSGPA